MGLHSEPRVSPAAPARRRVRADDVHRSPEQGAQPLPACLTRQYKHQDETNLARKRLADEFGLAEDPDVLFGLADNLFAAQRFADCFFVTSLILRAHDGHRPTMPLHLACMYHLPHLRPALFLLAHDLVDRQPDECVAWYAVGLWYLAGRRWDEARRFFGKAVLLDARHGPAWIAFAHTYALEGEHDQAITAYSTAQRHFQGSHLPVLFIGMQHLFLTNWTLATDYLDTAARICPDSDWLVANELGVCCYESNRCVDVAKTVLTGQTRASPRRVPEGDPAVRARPDERAAVRADVGQPRPRVPQASVRRSLAVPLTSQHVGRGDAGVQARPSARSSTSWRLARHRLLLRGDWSTPGCDRGATRGMHGLQQLD